MTLEGGRGFPLKTSKNESYSYIYGSMCYGSPPEAVTQDNPPLTQRRLPTALHSIQAQSSVSRQIDWMYCISNHDWLIKNKQTNNQLSTHLGGDKVTTRL